MYEGNPGEIDFGPSLRDVRVSKGFARNWYLDQKWKGRFEKLGGCLVFNSERRFDKENSIVDCALFLARSFLNYINLNLKAATNWEPRKTRNFLYFVCSNNDICLSVFQLKIIFNNLNTWQTNKPLRFYAVVLWFWFIIISPFTLNIYKEFRKMRQGSPRKLIRLMKRTTFKNIWRNFLNKILA